MYNLRYKLMKYLSISVVGTLATAFVMELRKVNQKFEEKNKQQLPVSSSTAESSSKLSVSKTVRNLISSVGAGTFIAYTTFPLEGYKKYLERRDKHFDEKFKPYKGSALFAANIIPTTTINFLTYGAINYFMPQQPNFAHMALASSFAGITGALTGTVVENTIVWQQKNNCGPSTALKEMVNSGGVTRLWRSYPHIATRDGIFTFVMFMALPEVEKYMNKHNYSESSKLLAGLLVCIAGAAASHPADMIGTRSQESSVKIPTLTIAKDIYKTDGIKGFYKGFGSRVGLFCGFVYALPEIKKLTDYSMAEVYKPEETLRPLLTK